MLQHYKILTVTHQQTNLKKIGHFAIPSDNQSVITEHLRVLKQKFGLSELLYLATCNRVQFILICSEELTEDFVQAFFKAVNPELSTTDIAEEVIALEGPAVVDHFFRVGASMDSLVIGERQILGQLREAYDYALNQGFIQDDLRLLFQRMVLGAKDVYANTRIGEKPVSIASLAVKKLMQQQLPTEARILIIGAGQTNNLVSKFLLKHHYTNIAVFNRSLPRATQLASKFASATSFLLEDIKQYRGGFDCIVVCTGAKDPVLTADVYEALLNGEPAIGKIVVDLAIPHNTTQEVLQTFDPIYIEIEGLRQLAAENMAFRSQEIDTAQTLLQEHIIGYPTLYKQRQLERAFQEVPQAVRAVREKAINEVFRKDIEQLDDEAQAVITQMMAYMEKKCIGIPMRVAREALL